MVIYEAIYKVASESANNKEIRNALLDANKKLLGEE
jgi:hypothetical protein